MNRIAAFLALFACLTAMSLPPARAQDTSDSDSADIAAARLQVKLSELEEEMRRMQGSIEQLNFQNKQLKDQLDKSNSDTAYRLDALEKKQAPAAANAVSSGNTPDAAGSDQLKPVDPVTDNPDDISGKDTPPPAPAKFATPRDQYNYAFKLLNQAKYNDAGAAFTAFTAQHPKDPLIGNAYYWLGETFYVRRDYLKAANNFRQGYESMPAGPKAADNLLKLAMALNALNKDKDACVVLKQVSVKFGAGSSGIKARTVQKMNRIGCS